ncbi:MAG TPA: serine/threonine-protein kinase [Aquabacterium sp.]|nr:serine/threonine-protein kinase [Aquabacterium sp.]
MLPTGIDPQRWSLLSPLLDELLDQPPDARAARLDALRAEDPVQADVLAQLLGQLTEVDREAFLEHPALTTPPAGRAAEDLAGRRVGAYTLDRELGRGGMGSVWLARRTDGRYEGEVAIKFLQGGLLRRGEEARFAREGSILARLAHPNIARLLDAGHLGVGASPAQPYLVLEYVAGEPLDRHCEQQGLDLRARLRLFLDVLGAVAHAHNRLILHRDLKPSNILVTPAGEVKLLDFGIAKLLDDAGQATGDGDVTQAAGRAFTPQYAAPEQLEGGDVTTATDVYSLGVLLFKLLGGAHPTGGDDPTTTSLQKMQAVVDQEPQRLSDAALRNGGPGAAKRARELKGDLDTIVARALKKAPAERYANAAAMADDIQRYLDHLPITARPDGWRYRTAKFLRRNSVSVAAGTATALALTGAAAVAWHEARVAQQQQAQAEGLIEFMLGDMPPRLKSVGRLDALDAVGDRALAYYAAQDPSRLDAASLGRRARALHLMGEIAEARGQLEEAARRFGEAASSTAELLARHPDVPQHLFNHAQSEYWVGFVARRRGLSREAEAAFGRYLSLAQRLVRLEPGKLDWRVEQAYAGQNLGVLLLEGGQPAEALRAFEQTRDAWQGVVPQRPAMNVELGNTMGWIAKAREARHDYAGAITAQQAKREAVSRMPDAATDRRAQYHSANALYEIGRLQLNLGQANEAAATASEAIERFALLVSADAENLDWLAQLALARLSRAEALRALGDDRAAREQLEPLQSIYARLMATPVRKVRWQVNLRGRLLTLQARLVGPGAGEDGPVADLLAYLVEMERRETADRPLEVDQVPIVAAAGLALGDAMLRRGRPEAAAPLWAAAVQRLQDAGQRGEAPAMALLGLLALRQGHPQDARAWAEKLEPTTYRHPDAAELHRWAEQKASPVR